MYDSINDLQNFIDEVTSKQKMVDSDQSLVMETLKDCVKEPKKKLVFPLWNLVVAQNKTHRQQA